MEKENQIQFQFPLDVTTEWSPTEIFKELFLPAGNPYQGKELIIRDQYGYADWDRGTFKIIGLSKNPKTFGMPMIKRSRSDTRYLLALNPYDSGWWAPLNPTLHNIASRTLWGVKYYEAELYRELFFRSPK